MKLITVYHCGESYHIDASLVGRSLQCRKCGNWFVIQEEGAVNVSGGPPPEPAEPKPSRPKSDLWGKAVSIWPPYVIAALVVITIFAIDSEHRQAKNLSFTIPATPPSVTSSEPNPYLRPLPPKPVSPAPLAVQPNQYREARIRELDAVFSNNPQTPLPPARSLPTGTDLVEPTGMNGHGVLTVRNGRREDSYLKLVEGVMVRKKVYIGAQSELTISKISPCDCRVMFEVGEDWDGKEHFTRGPSFVAFDESFSFAENVVRTQDGTETHYDTYNITLNPVTGGKAKTHPISKEEFDKAK